MFNYVQIKNFKTDKVKILNPYHGEAFKTINAYDAPPSDF
jgi:hypothetical protein